MLRMICHFEINWFSEKIFNPKALIKVQLTPDTNLNMRFFCQIYLKIQMFFVKIAKSRTYSRYWEYEC